MPSSIHKQIPISVTETVPHLVDTIHLMMRADSNLRDHCISHLEKFVSQEVTTAIEQANQNLLDQIAEKKVYVKYTKDGGLGVAVPVEEILKLRDSLTPPTELSESLESQTDRLAKFIVKNIPGEPSQSEGAIDTAIRLLKVSNPPPLSKLRLPENIVAMIDAATSNGWDMHTKIEIVKEELDKDLSSQKETFKQQVERLTALQTRFKGGEFVLRSDVLALLEESEEK